MSKTTFSKELFKDRYVVVACKKNSKVKDRITLEQYLDCRHIAWLPPDYKDHSFEVKFKEMDYHKKVVVNIPNLTLIPELITGTEFITTLPERTILSSSNRDDFQILDFPIELEPFAVELYWSKKDTENQGLVWLRNVIIDLCK